MADYPLGRREFSADFGGLKTSNLTLTKRPDALTFDYLQAFSLGPVQIGDSAQGPIYRAWYVRVDNATKTVYTARGNGPTATATAWEAEQVLFTFTGSDFDELDFAFEQAGRPVVCAERTVTGTKEVWLYWFKPSAGTFVFEKFDNGRTPRVVLDNPPDQAFSDVQFFYLKTGVGLRYRTQRELYAIVNDTPLDEETDYYIEDVFYSRDWRLVIMLSKHNLAGKYTASRIESTLLPVYQTGSEDSLGVVLQLTDAQLTLVVLTPDLFDKDDVTSLLSLISGALEDSIFYYPGSSDPHGTSPYLQDAPDDVTASFLPIASGSSLAEPIILHTLYDKDDVTATGEIQSGSLVTVIITHTLYDMDDVTAALTITSGDLS